MINRNVLLFLISVGFMEGCISRSVDNDIASLKSRMIQLENTISSRKNSLNEKSDLDSKNILAISSSIEEINIQLQKINGDLDYLKTAIKISSDTDRSSDTSFEASEPIGEVVLGMNQRLASLEESHTKLLDTIKSQLGSSASTSSSGAKASLKNVSDVQQAYSQKKYALITDEAPDLYKKVKTKQEKGEILYYLAESLFKQGQLNESALRFNELIEIKQKVPTAKLRLGDVFYKLGDKSTAKIYYQDLLDNHSKSKEARSAKEKLELISKQTSLRTNTGSSRKNQPSSNNTKRSRDSKRL